MATIQPAQRLNLVQEYYFSTKLKEIAEMKSRGLDVINLGIGSPDLPPSPQTIEALSNSAHNPKHHAYQSYVGLPALRQAFAGWYQTYFHVELIPANEILPLIGSKEGIMHIAMSYLEPGTIALVPNPGYPTYRAASLLTGAEVQDYELSAENGWLPDLKALAQTDLSRVRLMWVNYPHMPTGAQATPALYEELVAFGKEHNILIVNDNPYSFVLNETYQSILAVPGAKEVALELNSLSKSHNMAGWRMGMLAGGAEHVSNVLRFKSNMDSGMFLPLQEAAIQALANPPSWYADLNAIYRERQKKVFELLDLLDCAYDSQQTGMFVWAKIPASYADGYALSDEILYKANVFITPGGIFGSQGNGYIRISLCAEVEVFNASILRIRQIKGIC
ncbi:aminotransferase [Siphonobacter sp. BAB-5405]|uniref:aminotransferase class I/II-fold pyridoxal phosphate-dependent enzyme n=1 Tax=Siphonobacter sp. BAB-5405 TaxID=1864825 RepID=UPI000C7FD347|nr:aminotransferase class I/II-fold pyridoxal phosphate-dependent enzyme [Siphonobacter sp. BAB-5405]PMD95669.1 aminotransferase [Siphonobacter sp. BAB-5405]